MKTPPQGGVFVFKFMKIVMIADIHVGIPNRSKDTFWALEQIKEYSHKNQIKNWILLGDLYHCRDSISVPDLQHTTEFFKRLKYDGYRIDSVVGNHDMHLKNSTEINSLKPLSDYINLYENGETFKLGGQQFAVLNFIQSESEYMNELSRIEKQCEPCTVLLSHIGVKSSALNACFLLKSWNFVDFNNSKFEQVYLGHYHYKQQVGKNVWFVGSPISYDHSDGYEHGFFVYDTITRTHEFVSIYYGQSDSSPPKHMTVDDDSLEKLEPIDVVGNVVRIALTKEHTTNQINEISDRLLAMGAKSVSIMNLISKEDEIKFKEANDSAASVADLFKKFVENDTKGVKGLNIEYLHTINAEIMTEGDRQYLEKQ